MYAFMLQGEKIVSWIKAMNSICQLANGSISNEFGDNLRPRIKFEYLKYLHI